MWDDKASSRGSWHSTVGHVQRHAANVGSEEAAYPQRTKTKYCYMTNAILTITIFGIFN